MIPKYMDLTKPFFVRTLPLLGVTDFDRAVADSPTGIHWRQLVAVMNPEGVEKIPAALEVQENGTLILKINNQQVVSVPPNCTLSLSRGHASGVIFLGVEGETSQSLDACRELNKHDTTDQIKT